MSASVMRVQAHEPEWMDRLEDALAEGARRRRAIVVKPTGQGFGPDNDW
jgi:hypothetical protein